ncbi:MAG: hypothetical protein CVV42_01415 [Candidatus Riflebacteria bacterium HGW-Riflebacteria-2]|jgi:hypothetical protein|nr:MAG: hypothetical protein CVV42_01415 [Candidatus Riflebacteria bacterium HGW-Riflebacteria-2]
MKLLKKLMLLLTLLVCAVTFSGCTDKFFFPAAHFTVVSVTPDKLRLPKKAETTTEEGAEESSEEDDVILPSTSISLLSDSSVPANLVSFSITYTTRLGDPIPSVEVPETPYNLQLAAAATTEIPMNPYTSRLFNLLELTRADISPVNAKMILTVKDINGNKIQVEAHCLCYARWDEFDTGG